jgi:hypothetical protein
VWRFNIIPSASASPDKQKKAASTTATTQVTLPTSLSPSTRFQIPIDHVSGRTIKPPGAGRPLRARASDLAVLGGGTPPIESRCEPLYAPASSSRRRRTEGSVFNFAAVEQSLPPPSARIVRLINGIEAVQDGRDQPGNVLANIQNGPNFAIAGPWHHRWGNGRPMLSRVSRANARQAENFELRASAVIGDRNRDEFEQLGQHNVLVQHEARDEEKPRHAQEWLK